MMEEVHLTQKDPLTWLRRLNITLGDAQGPKRARPHCEGISLQRMVSTLKRETYNDDNGFEALLDDGQQAGLKRSSGKPMPS